MSTENISQNRAGSKRDVRRLRAHNLSLTRERDGLREQRDAPTRALARTRERLEFQRADAASAIAALDRVLACMESPAVMAAIEKALKNQEALATTEVLL